MARRNRYKATPQRQPMVRAKFDLAQTTQDNRRHWTNADGLAARAAISPAVRRVCRIRSRYESENNSWYAGILRTASNHIVGAAGPRLQVLTPDAAANRRIESAWRQWSQRVKLSDMLRTCVEAYWRDGEVFVMRSQSRLQGIGVDLLVLESDQIATPWQQSQLVDPFVDDGIRFDRATNEIEFYVYDHHPGLNTPVSTLSGAWYSSREVCHLYRAERPGQTRGIPRATPALQTLPIMRRQELATLFSAETAANFAMYLKSSSPAIDPADSPADFAEIELTRNMLTTLPAGWEIGQVEPKQPGPLYEMFQRQALMSFCRCTNMPYTLAAGTGKDANFSSFKGDMKNVWEPEVQVEQNRIQTDIVEHLWQWFLEAAVFVPGLLNGLPAIADIEHRWHWPPLPELDQVESAQAAEIRLKAGLSTLTEEHARRGKDWDLESTRAAADFGVSVNEYRAAVFAQTFDVQGAPQAPGAPTDTTVTTATTAVADTAMNGAQVTSIVQIIGQVAAGAIPAESARALIRSAFPAIPTVNVEQMLAPFANVAQQPPAAAPQTPATAAGEYMTIGQRAFSNNQKRIRKTLDDLATGTISEVMADQTLQSIGLSAERSRALIDDALGNGVTDEELQQVDAEGDADLIAALSDVDLTPTDGMVEEAKRGLAWRDEHGRGGTAVGIARARDIANRKKLSPETVSRMVRFFARHEVDKDGTGFSPGEDGFPSNGRIAWALWGGDAGQTWVASKFEQLKNAREVAK
jgi:lambda family phage portal protein